MNRFDKAAKTWDSKPTSVAIAKACVKNIEKYINIKQDIKILDYGSGTGLVAIALSNDSNEVLGMDYSQGMVDTFNEKIQKLGFDNIKAIKHDIHNDDLEKNSYDLITINMALHHLKDTEVFIKECNKALKKDGYLCINDLDEEDGTFHIKHKNDGVFHFGFSKDELCNLLVENGFEIIDYTIVLTDKRNDKEYPIFNLIAKKQEEFVIFGDPVAHSKSPQMQNAGFKSLDYNGIYKKHQLIDGSIIKETFLQNNYEGANITVPHKEYAFKNADEVRGLAQKIQAVNTYINENGKVIAYNTDAPGFLKAIESFGLVKSVLLLGAGGTAKAIALALQESNINVTVLNRSEGKLEFFKKEGIPCYSWDNFKAKDFDLIVNSTSAGLKDDYLPCDKELLESVFKTAKYAFDCVYGKVTPFLALAKENGLEIKDGEDMLLYQGVLAFEYFTKQKVDDKVSEAMRKGLKGN